MDKILFFSIGLSLFSLVRFDLSLSAETMDDRYAQSTRNVPRGSAIGDEMQCALQLKAISGLPASGTFQLKILLVEFQDVHCRKDSSNSFPRYTARDFVDLLGSTGTYVTPVKNSPDGDPVYGSMNDFFRAMSGGSINIQVSLVNRCNETTNRPEWIRLKYTKQHYQENTNYAIFSEPKAAAEALGLEVLPPIVGTRLVIIYAGNTYFHSGGLNPARLGDYYIMSELQGQPYNQETPDARFASIGFHCHEFAHTLGIGHSSGSRADLMCSGTRNGSVEGNMPAPLNPIARMKAGWVQAIPVDSLLDREVDIPYSLQEPTIYKMSNSNGDYFLIENRRFDQSMTIGSTVIPDYNNAAFFPAAGPHKTLTQGIFVWRVNAAGDILDPGYSTEGLVYASGRYGRTFPENSPSETDDGVPFPGVSNRRILSPWSDSRNPYTREADYFGSGTPHYNLFVPNTKGGCSWQMEIRSEDRDHGTFRLSFSPGTPPDSILNVAAYPDSLPVCESQRTLCTDSRGTMHQVLELGGEVFYRYRQSGMALWEGTCPLSSGNGGNRAPTITLAGSAIVAAWQAQASGLKDHVIRFRRSIDGGSTWSDIASLGFVYACTDSGPRPCLAGDRDGRVILTYATTTAILFAISGDGGESWGSSSPAFTFSRVWGGSSVIITESPERAPEAHLIVCADSLPGLRGVHFATFDFTRYAWGSSCDVSRILPIAYRGYRNPSFLIVGEAARRGVYAAWDANDSNEQDQNLIICRKVISRGLEDVLLIVRGKSLNDLNLIELGMLSTDVKDRGLQSTVAQGFRLEQNYPNPFNPLTIINYTVGGVRGQGPGASGIRLVVYDLLGREVAVLVDERKQPGSYEVSFDASALASGAYICRMQAGSFVQSRTMLLLK